MGRLRASEIHISDYLSRSTSLVVVVAAVVIYAVGQRAWSWYRLRHIKGPFWAALSDFWLIRLTWRGEVYQRLGDVCRQYGPIARIAPNYVVCGDPIEVRRMWGVRSQFDRAPWYKGFQLDPPRDCTLSMRDSELHTVLRAKLAPGYAGKGIEGLHESIDEGIARFVRLIEEKYLSTTEDFSPVDFARKVQYMTLDIISKIAFGESFGFMDEDADRFGYIKTTEDSLPLMQMIALIPWLVNVLQSRLFKAALPKDTDKIGIGRIMGTAKKVVAERYGSQKIDRPDMLGSFVRHGLSQKDAESESLVQIIAGSDTTATALRSILLNVVMNPTIYRSMQGEIDSGISDGRISSPITDAEARKLPFLQACIKEGFRYWPPITGIMPHISQRDGVIGGIHIPAGTNVAWSARAVMRNKDMFGADAEMFNPHRWLKGRWGCLGRPIAMLELNKMVVELMRRFDFAILNPEKPIKNSWYGVLVQSEMHMRITRREFAV
ncbi:Benzoate 4-monooxygenase cytochrome P450 [Pleurostoma richardsiae]|uniref:Benzoate 4-monooxygenase cytochrome P450 n=1 Tax=Pleurostoma richardsiae TaxID=41990 RepID=A0AA38RMZ4_9PEZI|nr:Benzoate 4-monooxygenase cytochrome P450 [Pleurostoma richardsiae]